MDDFAEGVPKRLCHTDAFAMIRLPGQHTTNKDVFLKWHLSIPWTLGL